MPVDLDIQVMNALVERKITAPTMVYVVMFLKKFSEEMGLTPT